MAKNRLTDWDTTAGNNTDVGGVNIAEGWAPENVNNAARETMSQLAEFHGDITGKLSTAGAAGAYTLTTNDGITAYAAGQLYAFIANHATTTGTPTLNVNTIGSKNITGLGGISADRIYLVAYEATSDEFQAIGGPEIPSGTAMIFYEDTAPIGWTIVAGVDEHAVRLTKGSAALGEAGGTIGGTQNFSTVFGTTATDNESAHTHSFTTGNNSATKVVSNAQLLVLTVADHPHTHSGTTNAGSAHSHAIDLRVKWASCIVASKD